MEMSEWKGYEKLFKNNYCVVAAFYVFLSLRQRTIKSSQSSGSALLSRHKPRHTLLEGGTFLVVFLYVVYRSAIKGRWYVVVTESDRLCICI